MAKAAPHARPVVAEAVTRAARWSIIVRVDSIREKSVVDGGSVMVVLVRLRCWCIRRGSKCLAKKTRLPLNILQITYLESMCINR